MKALIYCGEILYQRRGGWEGEGNPEDYRGFQYGTLGMMLIAIFELLSHSIFKFLREGVGAIITLGLCTHEMTNKVTILLCHSPEEKKCTDGHGQFMSRSRNESGLRKCKTARSRYGPVLPKEEIAVCAAFVIDPSHSLLLAL